MAGDEPKGPSRRADRKQGTRATSNPGLPDPASVVSEKMFLSPAGRRYRILRTNERDAYDPPDKPEKPKDE